MKETPLMSVTILVLPGDGIGPEITPPTLEVLQAADRALGLDLAFETHDIGLKSLAEKGTTLTDATMSRIPEVDGVILGPGLALRLPGPQRGRNQPLGRAAHQVRALLQHPTLPLPRRTEHPARADGPGDRAGEHRRLLLRPQHVRRHRRIHAGGRHGPVDPEGHRQGSRAGRTHRVRAGARAAARRSPRCTKPTSSRCPTDCSCSRSALWPRNTPTSNSKNCIVDATAALLIRGRRDSMSLVTTNMFGDILQRRGLRALGQPRPRRRHQRRRRPSASRRPSTAARPTSRAATSPTRPR